MVWYVEAKNVYLPVHDTHTMIVICMKDGTFVNFEWKFFSNVIVIYVCSNTHSFLGCTHPKPKNMCWTHEKGALNAPCVFFAIEMLWPWKLAIQYDSHISPKIRATTIKFYAMMFGFGCVLVLGMFVQDQESFQQTYHYQRFEVSTQL